MTTDDVFHEWINKQPKIHWKDAKEVKKLFIVWGDYIKDKYHAQQLTIPVVVPKGTLCGLCDKPTVDIDQKWCEYHDRQINM